MEWLAVVWGAVGTLFGIAGVLYGISNHLDAAKYRKLDRPWVAQAGGHLNAGHRSVEVRLANDENGRWEVIAARVASPGHARIAVTNTHDDEDGAGNFIPVPGEWRQSMPLERWDGTIHITPIAEPTRILFTLRARADHSHKFDSALTVYPPQR